MTALVVDTDVVSFLFKGHSLADLYRPHLAGQTAIITFMTRAELYRWSEDYNSGTGTLARLEAYLHGYLHYDSHSELCSRYAKVRTEAKRAGRPIDVADAWQAAVALLNDLPLVSHNRRHYAGIPGLKLISEA